MIERTPSPNSNHSSPLSDSNYDPESLDSSDTSSPSSDSYPSDPTTTLPLVNNWGFHSLGGFTSLLPGIVATNTTSSMGLDNNNNNDWSQGIKSINVLQQQQQQSLPNQVNATTTDSTTGEMELTSDFWSNNNEMNENYFGGNNNLTNGINGNLSNGNNQDVNMDGTRSVDFEDLLHQDVYGPASAISSPISSQPLPSIPLSLLPPSTSHYATPSFTIPHEPNFSLPMGISPQLTSTSRASPPLMSDSLLNGFLNSKPSMSSGATSSSRNHHQPQFHTHIKVEEDEQEEEDQEEEEEMDQDDQQSNGGASGSGERERNHYASVAKPTSSSYVKRDSLPISTNLVAKDAVVASNTISTLTTFPIAGSFDKLQLLVLGVPTIGAKSRVETQIKISLVLVRPKGKGKPTKGVEQDDGFLLSDGGLVPTAGNTLERIGSWTHLKLPNYLALKKKGKKITPDPSPEETLFLDVSVKRGSSSHQSSEEIFICGGCRSREEKRALRKKEARVRPVKDSDLPPPVDEEEEKRKVVIFNCGEFVEFNTGEVILPTRITCYCRHHKEKLGFSVFFTLKTASGIEVASGSTPPIMITDDHKTNHPKPSIAIAASSADVSLDSIDFKPVGPKTKKGKATAAAKQKADLAKSKRAGQGRKASRGVSMVESEDELLPEPSSRMQATKQHGVAKPYDSEARPSRSKRQPSGVHRSPAFAMTPLSGVSKPSSPVLQAQSDQSGLASLPLSNQSWDSSLGLGGMDSFMGDGTTASSAYSTSGMSAPSPAQSYDWRSAASSPSANSGIESYNPFYNSIASPLSTLPSPTNTSGMISPPIQQQSVSQISQGLGNFSQFYNTPLPSSVVSSAFNWAFPTPAPPPPRVSRLIPGEGPVQGGIEVTVLGENFVRDLVCVFGDTAAVSTHYWSSNTLVCILPPCASPGPVVVGIKGVPLQVDAGTQLQLFTYRADADRALLELALQVVGMNMTGKLEEASAVAQRIVGNRAQSTPTNSRQVSPTDTVGLAMSMNAAADSVYNTPNNSRPPSRQASMVNLTSLSSMSQPTLPHSISMVGGGQSRNFEGIVIKFLSLLDLDPSLIPGSAPSLPLTQSPISILNAQKHSLLHFAAVLGFHRLSSFLLAREIDHSAVDRNGNTALHFAALYGRVAISRQLLDVGAVSSTRNLAGETPLDIARDRDDVDVQELLLRSRAVNVTRSIPQQPQLIPVRQQYPTTSTPTYSRRASFDSTADYSNLSDSSDYSSSSDNDDESFHSSDEDGELSDVERGFSRSRNASMVSLHYLLDAEEVVSSQHNSPIIEAIPIPEEKNFQSLLRTSSTLSNNSDLPRKIVPVTTPFAPSSEINKLLLTEKLPLSVVSGGGGVWEKMPRLPYANEAWEKMRLPNSFAMPPLQMPELSVFNASMPTFSPKTWIGRRGGGARSDGSASGVEESEGEGSGGVEAKLLSRDWRNLYGPWWQKGGVSSPPPPMYSPIDTLLQGTPSTSTLPPSTLLHPAPVQARLQRRVGFVANEDISDSVGIAPQTYLHHEKKLQGLKQDKMLFFFWVPVLLCVLILGGFSSFNSIKSFLL